MSKLVYLHTFGCQMNARDSEEVLGMLTAQGYEIAEGPEAADVILLNTCSVRAHAEERAFGKMGELSVLKKERPELVLGIIGCMAKLQQEQIFKRLPKVDLVAGPAELYDLPYLLAEIQEKRQLRTPHSEFRTRVMAVDRPFRPLDQKPAGDYRTPGVSAFVTIMEGCDKACTYCIVPKTRGQEISRPAEEIIQEIQRLSEAGYRDVTLLGQNVNSYGKRFPDGSGYKGPLGRLRLLEEDPDALLDFPQLLRMIDAALRESGGGSCQGDASPERSAGPTVAGLRSASGARSSLAALGTPWPLAPSDVQLSIRPATRPHSGRGFAATAPHTPPARLRIRFTTSHPFDATERLFEAMRDCESVCEWLHLPAQSGSNRILRAMRRGYTVEAYLKKIERLRELVPDISLSTDIIVGFPGETEEDVQATARLMEAVRYDNAYIFKYSPRPGTDAAAQEDNVPQEVKEARNQFLLQAQERLALERWRRFEGRTVEILVEESGKQPGQLFGRTRGHHGVIVQGPAEWIGRPLMVRVTRATPRTLFADQAATF